jgi:hypothetical protein
LRIPIPPGARFIRIDRDSADGLAPLVDMKFDAIRERLDAPHHRGGLLAPFRGYERRHVEAGSVLRFQRAVVLLDDQLHELGHEGRIQRSVIRIAEVGNQCEVKIPMRGVPGHASKTNTRLY